MGSSRFWRYFSRVVYAMLSIVATLLAIDILFVLKKLPPDVDTLNTSRREPLMPGIFSPPIVQSKKMASGKRVAAFVSAPILIAIITTTNATLTNALHDTHIAGTFFWGWSDVGMFAIAGQPAVQVLQKWYTLPQR